MYIFEQEDIREKIEAILNKDNFSHSELKNIILEFIQQFEDKSIFEDILNAINNAEDITEVAAEFAKNSDDEDFCDKKIFVVIKNLDGIEGNNLVKEYNSLEDAVRDIDDTYTGCCDDVCFAENVWFPLLCALQSNGWDYLVNYCSVFECDAQYIDEIREGWEADWEAGNC